MEHTVPGQKSTMLTKTRKFLLTLVLLISSTIIPAKAQVIEGTIGDIYKLGYIADFNSIALLSGDWNVPSSAVVFCLDGTARWQGTGDRRSYSVETTLDYLMPQGADRALGIMNYIIENYFDSFVEDPIYNNRSGYAVNATLWEFTTQYDGTFDSVSMMGLMSEGTEAYLIYDTIFNDLKANYSSIASDYRSTKYNLQFLLDPDPVYQDLLMISPVPEPSGALLFGVAGVCALMRRRRRL